MYPTLLKTPLARQHLSRSGCLALMVTAIQLSATAYQPALAQTPIPVTDEAQMSVATADNQGIPRVAADSDGGFVGVWENSGALDDPQDQTESLDSRFSNGVNPPLDGQEHPLLL